MALFGGIWPSHPDPIGEVDRLVDEEGVVGLKFYPYDIYDGVGEEVRMDDTEAVYPILEHAQKRGIRSVAVHKAIAMAGCPVQPFHPRDLDDALLAFPGLCFQIVHGGFAFLEETALQLTYYRNAAVVLEGASAYLVNAPLKFAEILAAFLMAGAADRIIWGTGCIGPPPAPPDRGVLGLRAAGGRYARATACRRSRRSSSRPSSEATSPASSASTVEAADVRPRRARRAVERRRPGMNEAHDPGRAQRDRGSLQRGGRRARGHRGDGAVRRLSVRDAPGGVAVRGAHRRDGAGLHDGRARSRSGRGSGWRRWPASWPWT